MFSSLFTRDAGFFAVEYVNRETWPRERLQALALAKLRRLVWHCYLRVPYYQASLAQAIAPHEIEGIADPARLPRVDASTWRAGGDGFVARAGEGGLDPRETAARRQAITLRADLWGGSVADRWALDPAGEVAATCGEGDAGSLHVHADHVLIEATGQGSLLVTDLHEYARPMLRVDTGVQGRWLDGTCPCGRTLPRLSLDRERS